MSNLMICTNSPKILNKLNESEENNEKYILEGEFAELNKLNRNGRIYTKDEYLKHLSYLRNDIKSGEGLLGELDHPDDRFEVKLKEASHRIIDLWYDADKNVVMGKVELLNTPNGKLAQSIVDQGIPLHISSRAAGTVNADNTVSIQQIYTYDLVAKPGFAGAVLHRVNESADAKEYTNDVKDFLQKTYKMESMNSAPQYGIVNEDLSVSEIRASASLRKEAKDLINNKQIEINEDMTKPLLENTNPDSTVGKPLNISGNGAEALGIPTSLDTNEATDSSSNEKDDKKDKKPATDVSDNSSEANDVPKNDDSKKEDSNECGDATVECGGADCAPADDKKEKEDVSEDEESSDDKEESKEDSEESSDEDASEESSDDKESSESSGVEILDVKAEFEDSEESSDDDMIKDVTPEFDDDDKKNDEESSDTDDKEESSEESNESKEVDCKGGSCDEKRSAEKTEADYDESKKLNDEKQEDIKSRQEKFNDKLDKLIASIENKNKSKESAKNESIIMAQYPVSMKLTESNFAKFISLSESQKNKVVAYLQDNNLATVQQINESWEKGIDYENPTPVWLKYAPENYKALYESATQQVKDSLAFTASCLVFENQNDVNIFWENSGLEEANRRRLLNESFLNNIPKTAKPVEQPKLPYSTDFIKQIGDMASSYNNRY